MNKYQESLNNLVKSSCPFKTCCSECDLKPICNREAKDWINDIQYLVDLNNPEFVKCPKGFVGDRYTAYYCPECGKRVKNDGSGHCRHCGKAIKYPKIKVSNNRAYLDWSDEDE